MLCAASFWLVLVTGVPDSGLDDPLPDSQAPIVMVASPSHQAPERSSPPERPAVPEPGTLLLVGGGLVGLAISSRRWRRAWASRAVN